MEKEAYEHAEIKGAGTALKLWQDYPGKNVICCRGLCMTGPNAVVFVMNIALQLLALGLFYGFVAIRFHPVLILVGFVLHGTVLYFLLRAAFTDPGILPRRATPVDTENPPSVVVDGKAIQLTYCSTCNIFRPLKTKHCRVSDNCVEEFDHYCPWVMNCVGKRNYRYFVGFVATISILCIFVCITTLALVLNAAINNETLPSSTVLVSIILILFTGCLGVSLSGFAGMHCMLITQGITTNEMIKGRAVENKKSCAQNCYKVYCTKIPPPNIDLQGPKYKEIDTEIGNPVEEKEIGEAS
mmetsp:Transcript_13523/g.20301  ORF Transcript_13523/g.20301 Transcript_13523/m.20301 type:complete len:298 (-) Transcript_13523:106-999(-)